MGTIHPRYLVEEVLPFVEQRYKVDASNRAIAGLSLGCMQVWRLLCTRPELFTAAGLFSGTADMEGLDSGSAADRLRDYRTVFVGIGDWDAPVLHESMTAAPALLDARGIRSKAYNTPGGHTWSVWQRCLIAFAEDLQRVGWVASES
jgi:enterochelin esterase-like enzyme